MFKNPVEHVPDEAAAGAGDAPSALLPPPTDAGKLKIVCVDDIPMNLRMIQLMMKGAGVGTVLAAKSGEEALKLVTEEVPDVLITDLWMPGMDGARLAAKIKAEPRLAGVKLIALTADAEASSSFDLAVFDQVLEKPLTPKKLQQVLSRRTVFVESTDEKFP